MNFYDRHNYKMFKENMEKYLESSKKEKVTVVSNDGSEFSFDKDGLDAFVAAVNSLPVDGPGRSL